MVYLYQRLFTLQTQDRKLCIVIGTSLSESYIDCDNGPCTWNNGTSVLVIPTFVTPLFPRSVYAPKCSVYSGILMCSYAWFTTAYLHLTEQQGQLEHYSVCCENMIIDEERYVNAQTHGINWFSLLRQWSCSYLATWQRDGLTVLLFCNIHIDIGTTLNLPQSAFFVDVEPYRLTVQRHQWHCWPCIYCHNIISSGSPPVVLECASYYLCMMCIIYIIYWGFDWASVVTAADIVRWRKHVYLHVSNTRT